MRYSQLRAYDVANGPGIRASFFVSGCTIRCKNCFNEEYQDFNFGNEWTEETTEEILEYLEDSNVEGLTILGGEPFDNAEDLLEIIKDLRTRTDKSIWIYSGYVFEKLIKNPVKKEILENVDVLVDGPFVEEKKDLMLAFRGSSNQRIIDLKKTFEENQIVLVNL